MVSECLYRLRWGRILAMTRQRFGEVVGEVVRMLLVYGRLKAGEVVSVMEADGDGRGESSFCCCGPRSLLQPACSDLLF